MKTHVQALVVGGGAVGTAIAYHLAKAGWSDVMLAARRLEESRAGAEQQRIGRPKLDAMLAYCESTGCRTESLLRFFGEPLCNLGEQRREFRFRFAVIDDLILGLVLFAPGTTYPARAHDGITESPICLTGAVSENDTGVHAPGSLIFNPPEHLHRITTAEQQPSLLAYAWVGAPEVLASHKMSFTRRKV